MKRKYTLILLILVCLIPVYAEVITTIQPDNVTVVNITMSPDTIESEYYWDISEVPKFGSFISANFQVTGFDDGGFPEDVFINISNRTSQDIPNSYEWSWDFSSFMIATVTDVNESVDGNFNTYMRVEVDDGPDNGFFDTIVLENTSITGTSDLITWRSKYLLWANSDCNCNVSIDCWNGTDWNNIEKRGVEGATVTIDQVYNLPTECSSGSILQIRTNNSASPRAGCEAGEKMIFRYYDGAANFHNDLGQIYTHAGVLNSAEDSGNFNTVLDTLINENSTAGIIITSTAAGGINLKFDETLNWTASRFVSQQFNTVEVLETSSQNFNSTFEFATGESIVIYLNYNGTKYLADKIESNTNNATFSIDIVIPLTGSSIENKTFNWEVTDSENTWNTNDTNQSVNQIYLTNCTAPATTQSLNFTLKDEETQLDTNGDIASDWLFWDSSGDGTITRTYSIAETNSNVHDFCIYPAYANLTVDLEAQYDADGYAQRTYYLDEHGINNNSQNINIYLLNESDSETFRLNLRDQAYKILQGAIIKTLRYYPEDATYITVDVCRTDFAGQCLTHLIQEDVFYRFMVDYEGSNILSTEGMAAYGCITKPCEINLIADQIVSPDGDGITSDFSYNNDTRLVTLSYDMTSGGSTSVTLLATQSGTICNTTSTSTAGVIVCNVTGYTDQILVEAYDSNNLRINIDYININEAYKAFGSDMLIWVFLAMLCCAMAGIALRSITMTVMLPTLILGMFVKMGLIGLSFSSVIALFVIIAFILFKSRSP